MRMQHIVEENKRDINALHVIICIEVEALVTFAMEVRESIGTQPHRGILMESL